VARAILPELKSRGKLDCRGIVLRFLDTDMYYSAARIYVRAFWCGLLLFPTFFIGCGGSGSGSSISPSPSSAPSFTLSLNPSQIDLSQSATQNVQVQVAPENGFSGSVTVTLTGLPSGVTSSPSSLSVSANSPGTLVLTAAAKATPGRVQVSIAGNSGSLQASAALALDVIQMAAPIAVPFSTTGGNIVKAFYDESRQLLFATNLALNEVDVLTGSSLSVQARIPIAQPFGIDQMPDGNTLVVGTFTQGFYTIDENTLAVTHYPAPNFTQQFSTVVLLIPVAMANGNVLFMGKDFGVASADIFIYGGQAIIEWNSSSGQFSMPFYVPYLSFEIDNLKRSANHNWAVYAADKVYIYSSATDSFTSSVDPINSAPFGVRDTAANPNGTQFAVVSAYSVAFYDGSFNALGSVNLGATAGLLFDHGNTQYSANGSQLYWEMGGDQGGGSVVDVLDTVNFADIGSVASNIGIETQFVPDMLWIDSSQQAFLSELGGVGELGISTLRTGMPAMAGGVGPNPSVIPLNQSVAVTLNPTNSALPVGTSVTLGGLIAPQESNNSNNNPMVVQVPASSVAGPANLVLTQPDGETLVEPQHFVYGVDVAAPTSTLVPPIGNPVMGLFGFGILNGPLASPTITVGGQNVANAAVNPNANYILQELFLQLPNGAPGPADITITSVNGTGTLKGAVTYIPFAKIIPATSSFVQILYDTHRSLLYALQSNEIQVLNPTTLQWQNPLIPGGSRGFGYVSMALTPDGTEMVVLDATANTLTVFDPDNPSQSVTTSVKPNSGTLENVVTTRTGKAFIAIYGGTPIAFDLATNTYATTNTFSGLPSRFVATPDGNHVAGVNQNSRSGTLTTWSAAGGSSAQSLTGIVWTDVAVSNDGSLFAALEGVVGYAGNYAAFFDRELHFTDVTVYPDLAPPDQSFCTGAIFSASGSTLLNPLADSIDFFSTQTATLQGRLLMPEPLPVGDLTAGTIALDPNQETIYAISASGLTVVTLPSSVDLVTPFSWPYVAKPPHSASPGTHGQLRRIDTAAR
jgi:hypothetical protein